MQLQSFQLVLWQIILIFYQISWKCKFSSEKPPERDACYNESYILIRYDNIAFGISTRGTLPSILTRMLVLRIQGENSSYLRWLQFLKLTFSINMWSSVSKPTNGHTLQFPSNFAQQPRFINLPGYGAHTWAVCNPICEAHPWGLFSFYLALPTNSHPPTKLRISASFIAVAADCFLVAFPSLQAAGSGSQGLPWETLRCLVLLPK